MTEIENTYYATLLEGASEQFTEIYNSLIQIIKKSIEIFGTFFALIKQNTLS